MNRQTMGIVGVMMLAIGVFSPLVTMPIVGSLNYFNNGSGDGVIILVLAAVSLLIVVAKKYSALWLTGLISLGLIGHTFMGMLEVIRKVKQELADNIFGGLVNPQLQWGWVVLVLGALLLLATAGKKESNPPQMTAENL